VGRILHTPTRRLREARADVRGPASVQLLRWLFGVDGDPGGSVAARP
jgi:hypothetical protein